MYVCMYVMEQKLKQINQSADLSSSRAFYARHFPHFWESFSKEINNFDFHQFFNFDKGPSRSKSANSCIAPAYTIDVTKVMHLIYFLENNRRN